MFELDTVFHILRFHIRSINLSWGISHRINDLKVIYFDKEGYVEFETNIGIESIDILDDSISDKDKNIILNYLSNTDSLGVKIILYITKISV